MPKATESFFPTRVLPLPFLTSQLPVLRVLDVVRHRLFSFVDADVIDIIAAVAGVVFASAVVCRVLTQAAQLSQHGRLARNSSEA